MKTAARVVVLALILTGPLSAQSQDHTKELIQIEEAWASAVLAGDVDALRRIIADDYIGTTAGGAIQNKEQYLADFISGERNTSLLTTKDLRVRVYGTTAVLTHRGSAEGKVRGRKIEGRFRWTHVFIQREERWQAVANHVTRISESQASRSGEGQ